MSNHPLTAYRALCCDCLRGLVFPTAEAQQTAHAGESACVCGGHDVCACLDCLWTLERLEAGSRDPVELDLIDGVNLAGWTPEAGIK
jgi:hypothetical protein